MGENGIQTLRMLRGSAETGAVHGAHDQRRHRLASKHVAELGGLVENLIETNSHEIDEHQLHDRPQPGGGGANGSPHEGRFGDRRIHHAVAELVPQSLGDSEHPAPGIHRTIRAASAGDVLAHYDDGRIALHLLCQRFVDGLLKADFPAHDFCLSCLSTKRTHR